MAKLKEIYRCETCGHIIEILHEGQGELVCCNEPMKHLEANTVDAAQEKHVPVVEVADGLVKVNVGSADHPMEEDHFIEWIEVIIDGRVYRKHLQPGDAPHAEFAVSGDNIVAREYCNLHGLWKKE